MVYQQVVHLPDFWLPVIGFVIGMLATMVGGSGAFFFPPALILLFQVSPRVAVATSLAAAIPVGLVGSFGHYRHHNINLPVAIVFGVAGLSGALSGAWISGLMTPDTLISIFGIYTIVLGLLMLRVRKSPPPEDLIPPRRIRSMSPGQLATMIFFGMASGLAAGLFGTSGTAPVLAGLFLLRLPLRQVIGTSVLVVLINSASGFGGHLVLGEINTRLILLLGSGATLGAFLGPMLVGRIHLEKKEAPIRYVYAILVIVLGIVLLFR